MKVKTGLLLSIGLMFFSLSGCVVNDVKKEQHVPTAEELEDKRVYKVLVASMREISHKLSEIEHVYNLMDEKDGLKFKKEWPKVKEMNMKVYSLHYTNSSLKLIKKIAQKIGYRLKVYGNKSLDPIIDIPKGSYRVGDLFLMISNQTDSSYKLMINVRRKLIKVYMGK